MSKPSFIQLVIAINKTPVPKIEAGVRYAEEAWEELTRLGYGSPRKAKPRENQDYYNQLNDRQREWLDKFRKAFGLKYATLQRTALSWFKLGELSDEDYQQIVEAGRHEASIRGTRETTAPYAERWLNEHRFKDFKVSKQQQKNDELKDRKQELKRELNNLLMFQQQLPDIADQHQPRIDQIKAELGELDQ